MKSVSVIIPAKTDCTVLRRCLDSVSRQTFPREQMEVVVAYSDMSDCIESVRSEFPDIRFLPSQRPGPAAARNLAVENCSGDILAFLDVDCTAHADWLERGVAHCAEAKDDFGLIGGRIDVTYAKTDRPTLRERYSRIVDFPQDRFIAESHFSATANMFTLRSVWDEVGPLDEESFPGYGGEDKDWGMRVFRGGRTLTYAPDVAVHHPARTSAEERRKKHACVARSDAVLQKKYADIDLTLIRPKHSLFGRIGRIFKHPESGTLLQKCGLALLALID